MTATPEQFRLHLQSQEEYLSRALQSRLLDARSEIDHALEALDKGWAVNSSGILNQTADAVDRLAVEYMAAAQTRGQFERAFDLGEQS